MTDALQAYLESVRDKPFAWGEHDCRIFAARAFDAAHGTDLASKAAAFNVRSAFQYRALQRAGLSIEGIVCAELGAPVSGEPQRGDLVLTRTTHGLTLAIAVPPVVLRAGPDGIEPLPMTCVEHFWRKG